MMREHNNASCFADAIDIVKQLKEDYIVVLATDADKVMVDKHTKTFQFDKVFISEELKAYKGNSNMVFFRKMIEDLGVKANQILHIGDSISDIDGSNNLGIDSCHINRDGRVIGRSTYSITLLSELKTKLAL